MTYRTWTLLFAATLAALAFVVGNSTKRKPDLYRQLPRSRSFGTVLGVICLFWSLDLVLPMLEGNLERYHGLARAMVPVLAILCYFYLDYLFARSLGGFVVLCVNAMLHAAFVVNLPLRPLYAIVSYVVAIGGMVAVASPWLFRDLLQRSAKEARWRMAWAGGLGGLAVFYTVFAFIR